MPSSFWPKRKDSSSSKRPPCARISLYQKFPFWYPNSSLQTRYPTISHCSIFFEGDVIKFRKSFLEWDITKLNIFPKSNSPSSHLRNNKLNKQGGQTSNVKPSAVFGATFGLGGGPPEGLLAIQTSHHQSSEGIFFSCKMPQPFGTEGNFSVFKNPTPSQQDAQEGCNFTLHKMTASLIISSIPKEVFGNFLH